MNKFISSNTYKISLSIMLITLLTACRGGSSGGGADMTAPSVSNTTPASSATAVARNSTITATFNEDMFAITVDASSFTLANSGSVNGTVSFDGATNIATFTPSSELAVLATYNATLNTAITDLSGNALATDYSWSFVTADGVWGTAELIETGNAGVAEAHQVAFDNNGNALAVWWQKDGSRHNILANRFDGTNWGTPELIDTDNAVVATAPQVAFDNNGNAIAVWWQRDGSYSNIYANRFNGTRWGTAELIEYDNAGGASAPQVAFDDNGNALVVWVQYDGRSTIYANRFDGTNWGTPEPIDTDNAGQAFTPQVAFDNNGNALAVWEQRDGPSNNIYANHFDGTRWGTAELIETNNAGSAKYAQVAFDNSGNALVVWEQYDGSRYNIYANRFDGTRWGTAELIETDNAGYAGRPQVAFDNNGSALAVWGQYDGNHNNIYANRFDGTRWGTAELIETDNAGHAFFAQVAFDNNGNALVVWEQYDGSRNNIWANRFDGASWGAAALIETDNAGSAYSPQVAFDSNGNAIAVWSQNDGSRNNIWANSFK